MAYPYTIIFWEQQCADHPPLAPESVRTDMHAVINGIRRGALAVSEAEERLIRHGKALWPYRRAFADLSAWFHAHIGTHFLAPHIPKPLQRKCNEFAAHGGTLEHLRRSPPASFFDETERETLRAAFARQERDIKAHTVQAALSSHRREYETLINRYEASLTAMEADREALLTLARAEEEDFPDLAAEIRASVRGVDESLCQLGPGCAPDALARAREHFLGRKREKKMRI
jgi:hypothetical protein